MPPIPPLPTPFPVPPAGSSGLDFTQLWSIENYSAMVSIIQSIFILANQNLVISAFVVLSVIALIFYALSRMLGSAAETPDGSAYNQSVRHFARQGRTSASRVDRSI